MLAFLTNNLSTILVGLALLALVVWVSLRLWKKRKSGVSATCGCGCAGCPSASMCHKR